MAFDTLVGSFTRVIDHTLVSMLVKCEILFSLLFSIGFSNQISVIIFSIPFIATLVLNTDFSSLMYLPCFL